MKAFNLKDIKINHLTGIIRVQDKLYSGGSKSIQWLFRCDCGNDRVLTVSRVTRGVTKHCGCRNFENRNRKYEVKTASYRAKASTCKAGAKIREIPWELSLEEASFLLQGNCFYCTTPPSIPFNAINSRTKKERENSKMSREHISNSSVCYSGIDRLDSNLGYTVKNSVSCCKTCNFAKNSMTVQQFYDWVQLISRNFKI